MIENLRVIAIIPARGQSKSIPRKNLRLLGDKPLISWAIECALGSPEVDRVIVSTDDQAIASVSREYGAEVYERPPELATDTSLIADTLRDLWSRLRIEGDQADIFLLLEPTSPFRDSSLINRCLKRLVSEQFDSIATFNEAAINPERVWRITEGIPQTFIEGAVPWKPRQLLSKAYQLNGALYAFFPDRWPSGIPNILFGRSGAEVIPADDAFDIDNSIDLFLANELLKQRSANAIE